MNAGKKCYFLVLGILVLCGAASASAMKAVDISNLLKPDLSKDGKNYYFNRATGKYVQYQHKISYWFPSGFYINNDSDWYKQWDFKTPDDYTVARSYFRIGQDNQYWATFEANITFYWLDKFKVVGANMIFWKNSIHCGYQVGFSVYHNCQYKQEGMYPPNTGYDGKYVDLSEGQTVAIAYIYFNKAYDEFPADTNDWNWGTAARFVVNIYYNDL
ncbi:hypothetical protein [Cysteiniphilum sp. QT6929]|uniref:hypothetical protein n=1 Tax=Cysteiniphilum sp. QT6929 TaxID=2975055 RepID=UPI0024B3832A|nr:hypothetical protein [Cysteiniphilum sp. QT6929]WHN65123.1 hypothetical protein NYP54_08735 [Cysteiniphilum sp. QT6929]